MLYIRTIVFGLFMVLVSTNSYAASFDCALAKTKVEKAICNNVELSALDDQLAISYKKSLSAHPFPEYVKSRQREWLDGNNYCDANRLVACLKSRYLDRIDQLQARNLAVYSARNQFTYPSLDTVIEVWQSTHGQWRLSVWGGFVMHRVATDEAGKPVFTGCEFEGIMKSNTATKATSIEDKNLVLEIEVNSKTFTFMDEPEICAGFARLPDSSFYRIVKR